MKQHTMGYRPETVEVLVSGLFRVYYEIQESTETQGGGEDGEETREVPVWICSAVDVEKVDLENIVTAIIREKYSLSAELSLLRQRDTKEEEFQEYFDWAEYAKTKAHEIVG